MLDYLKSRIKSFAALLLVPLFNMDDSGAKKRKATTDAEPEAGEIVETDQVKSKAFLSSISPRCDSVSYVKKMRSAALLGIFQASTGQVITTKELNGSFMSPAGFTAIRQAKSNKIEELTLDGRMLAPNVRDKMLAYQTCANRGLAGCIECLNGEWLLVRRTSHEGTVVVNSAAYWDYSLADDILVATVLRVWEIIAEQKSAYTANCLKSLCSYLLAFVRRTKRTPLVEGQDKMLIDALDGDPAAVLINLFPVVFNTSGASAQHVAESLIACLCSNTNVDTLIETLIEHCTPRDTLAGVLMSSNLFHVPEVPVQHTLFRLKGCVNDAVVVPLHDVPAGSVVLCKEALPSGSEIVGIGRTSMVYAFPRSEDMIVEKSTSSARNKRHFHALKAPHMVDARVLLAMAEHMCPQTISATVPSTSGAAALPSILSTFDPEDSEGESA